MIQMLIRLSFLDMAHKQSLIDFLTVKCLKETLCVNFFFRLLTLFTLNVHLSPSFNYINKVTLNKSDL